MKRSVIVGDVHGCRDELERLLELVRYDERDDLYFLGDLLSRGPDPEGVLALFRRTKARGVRGNHDDVLVQWHTSPHGRAGRSQPALAEHLDPEDWALLESLPLYLDLPSHGVRLVHAGVIPGKPIDQHPREALLSMRYLGPAHEPIEKGGTVLWGTRYVGPPHVVFGHNARLEPQIHAWATGLDTSAVYGERLTAMVLNEGQEVPPPERRRSVLFSVPSSARYYVPKVR
ncbi:MAG TPA: metallophosphoesterase family protein [Polyangiaceae bacterium]|nr:metallophosphoesterase family protein [Polyangiaceae bacterium]